MAEIKDIYRGPTQGDTFARGFKECEEQWNLEVKESSFDEPIKVPPFRTLLLDALENAKAEKRSDVNIVDIGCGSGRIFPSFFDDKEESKDVVKFLKENPGIKLNYIGATDLGGEYSSYWINNLDKSSLRDLANVTFGIRRFTFTVNQTMEDFLRRINVENVDVALATWSLNYMGIKAFSNIIDGVTEHLVPGGRFIGAVYSDYITPGTVAEGPGISLDVRNIKIDEKTGTGKRSFQNVILSAYERLIKNFDEAELELQEIDKAEEKLVRMNVLDEDQLESALVDLLISFDMGEAFGAEFSSMKNAHQRITFFDQNRQDFIEEIELQTVNMSKEEKRRYLREKILGRFQEYEGIKQPEPKEIESEEVHVGMPENLDNGGFIPPGMRYIIGYEEVEKIKIIPEIAYDKLHERGTLIMASHEKLVLKQHSKLKTAKQNALKVLADRRGDAIEVNFNEEPNSRVFMISKPLEK